MLGWSVDTFMTASDYRSLARPERIEFVRTIIISRKPRSSLLRQFPRKSLPAGGAGLIWGFGTLIAKEQPEQEG
jgi:hypothetical protein